MIDYLKEQLLEKIQKEVDSLGVGGLKQKISDGYHTFEELYEHRNMLFIALCRTIHNTTDPQQERICRTPIKDGWFLLILFGRDGSQISYHLPHEMFSRCTFAKPIVDYDFDGHTSHDVLERLKTI